MTLPKVLAGICAALVLWGTVGVGQTAKGGEISFLADDAMLAIVVQPAAMLSAPGMEQLPTEVYSVAGTRNLGINPLDVEQCIIQFIHPELSELRRTGVAAHVGFVVRLSKPFHLDSLAQPILKATESATWQGRSYRRATGEAKPGYSYYMPDERTLIIATDAVLTKMLAEPSRQTTLRKTLETAPEQHVVAALDVEMQRALYQEAWAAAPRLLPVWDQISRLAEHVDLLTIRLELGQQIKAEMFLKTSNDSAVANVEQMTKRVLVAGRDALLKQLQRMLPAMNDPVKAAAHQYFERMANNVLRQLKFQRQETGLAVRFQGETSLAAAGIVTALAMPALQASQARVQHLAPATSPAVAPKDDFADIARAMHRYHSIYGELPTRASFDKEGKPLLSWRVHLLPYLGQRVLHDRFRLNEPWDSEHNKKLIPLMPEIYRGLNSAAEQGKATRLVLVGKSYAFEGEKGKRLADFTDGTANSVLLVEVDDAQAIEWTKPHDYEVDLDNPTAGLRRLPDDSFPALFADGKRRLISLKRPAQEIHALFTIAGGEPIEPQPRPMR